MFSYGNEQIMYFEVILLLAIYHEIQIKTQNNFVKG